MIILLRHIKKLPSELSYESRGEAFLYDVFLQKSFFTNQL